VGRAETRDKGRDSLHRQGQANLRDKLNRRVSRPSRRQLSRPARR
jgi:hypothetical protein